MSDDGDRDIEAWRSLDLRDGKALLLWLAHGIGHHNRAESLLDEAWERAGLPGKLPLDDHHMIDLCAVAQLRDGLRRWPDGADGIAVSVARWYSFESSYDMTAIEDQARAAGFDVHEFDLDLVVVEP